LEVGVKDRRLCERAGSNILSLFVSRGRWRFSTRHNKIHDTSNIFNIFPALRYVCFSRIKRAKAKGTKCHAKTMMSIKADKTVKEEPSICRVGRTWRDKDEGGG
jgi:hypothetical protein